MPFLQTNSDDPARIRLEQVGRKTFRLLEPFRYRHPPTAREYTIRASDPDDESDTTDLASVPWLLTWFVQRYGRHTLAALMHDQLVDDPSVDREMADSLFRDAMGELGVPLVRRWVMWAAVSIATLWAKERVRGVFAILWLLPWAVIPFLVTASLIRWDWVGPVPLWVIAIVTAVGPLLASLVFWLRRYLVGVVSGYSVILLAVPTVAVVIAMGLYSAGEWLARLIGPTPSPAAPLPEATVRPAIDQPPPDLVLMSTEVLPPPVDEPVDPAT